jgi:hypothetical protein
MSKMSVTTATTTTATTTRLGCNGSNQRGNLRWVACVIKGGKQQISVRRATDAYSTCFKIDTDGNHSSQWTQCLRDVFDTRTATHALHAQFDSTHGKILANTRFVPIMALSLTLPQ